MNLLNPELEARLRQRHVEVQIQDTDTVLLRNVPADTRRFNKPATNVLVARPHDGMPFLVCVDEDLEYTGRNRFLIRVFAGAQQKRGWRVLNLGYEACRDLHQALELALGALGFDQRGPGAGHGGAHLRSPDSGSMLAHFGTDLTRAVRNPEVEPTVGRKQEVERVAASTSGWQGRLPLIEGESGVGKTNLLHALARRLAGHHPGARVISVNLGVLLAGTLCESERENVLSALFGEIAGDPANRVLAMEHLEMAFLHNPRGALLVEQALEDGLRLVGTALPRSMPRGAFEALSRRVDVVRLGELDPAASAEALALLCGRIARHHRVRIDASILKPVVERSVGLAGCLPAKAISLLDSAAARAALLGDGEVEILHVYLAGDDFPSADFES